jgi:microcystin-dependent protein
MNRVYTAGASATPPTLPESMPNPNHYPSHAAIFDPYQAHVIIEELCNIATAAGAELDPASTNQCITAIQALIASAGVGNPTGAVLPYAGTTAPAGYLLCTGDNVSRTTYAALFAVIGTTFGEGDGSTTFGLPNLKGRFPLGKDNMGGTSANVVTATAADNLGGTGGEESHTLTIAEIPAHSHSYSQHNAGGSGMTDNGNNNGNVTANTGSTGGGQPHNNMPPYITLNYIIKT